jgi:hypothetical protein
MADRMTNESGRDVLLLDHLFSQVIAHRSAHFVDSRLGDGRRQARTQELFTGIDRSRTLTAEA